MSADFGLGPDRLLRLGEADAEHDLWALFEERAAVLGCRFGWPEASGQWFVDGTAPPFEVSRTDDVWQAEVGVTPTVCAVAETGSILVAGGHRLASLAPPIHVAVVGEIVLRLEHAIEKLARENAALITGPSRTADIEGVMVKGAHGPKELWIVKT